MGLWIPFTLFAAFMQSWRNAFQSQLSKEVSTAGVTLARFIYASPLAVLYLVVLYQVSPAPLPTVTTKLSVMVILASVSQIVATALMVKLFQLRNYAIGVGLAKSEAIIAATLGALFFAAPLNMLAWVGVIVGGIAVWLMSAAGSFKTLSWRTVLLGVGSGLAFALTTLWVREASLILALPFPHGAAWVLVAVISLQTLMLLAWIGWREPKTLHALYQRPKKTFLISLCSCLGSLGWFTAMSLETVALVKTLGQVEVLFTLLISARFFKDTLAPRDLLGLGLIVAGAVCVVIA